MGHPTRDALFQNLLGGGVHWKESRKFKPNIRHGRMQMWFQEQSSVGRMDVGLGEPGNFAEMKMGLGPLHPPPPKLLIDRQ